MSVDDVDEDVDEEAIEAEDKDDVDDPAVSRVNKDKS